MKNTQILTSDNNHTNANKDKLIEETKKSGISEGKNEKDIHASGFGHRNDNYFAGNLGYSDNIDVYLVSAEVDKNVKVNSSGVDIGGELGLGVLDIEIQSDKYEIVENLNISSGSQVEVLSAGVNGAIGLSKSAIGAKGEIMAVGASGEISGSLEIFGITITLTAEGYAGSFGAGGELMWSKKEGLTIGLRVAKVFGVGGSITIK